MLKIMGYRLDKHLVVTDSILVKNVPLSGKETMGRYILQQYISSFDREPGIFLAVIMNEDLQRDTLYTIEGNHLKPHSRLDFAFTDKREEFNILEITGQGDYFFMTYRSDKHPISQFVYNKEKNVGYDLKKGFTVADGTKQLLHAFGDGDYFYIRKETDETGFELNPIIVWVKLKE
ncbi:hypothetical protein [Cyclobacterium plantarum]|uniref:Uncharacterized protein n=1 Tax=Cyclobacterium plantarum TaxID=2716263 RepID=A0ABX0HBX5_9BACT|nr:hypothetical protein [Cyclobacterium plantarum]NHE57844.1 hypothetical protein [Cyclobacterium plantarum]